MTQCASPGFPLIFLLLDLVFWAHHREIRIFFGIADILLIGSAFDLAHIIRGRLGTEHFLGRPARRIGPSPLASGSVIGGELYDRRSSAQHSPRCVSAMPVRAGSLILFEPSSANFEHLRFNAAGRDQGQVVISTLVGRDARKGQEKGNVLDVCRIAKCGRV